MRVTDASDIHTLAGKVQPELLRVLAALPRRRQSEVLDFARFLGQLSAQQAPAQTAPAFRIVLRPVPADSLLHLTDLVALGGDALLDSEALYDDNGGN
jgi:hypothetical protein